MKRLVVAAFALAGCVLFGPARADDLTGIDRFLCSAGSLSVCCDDGACASGEPAELDLPQFIEVDLVQKSLSSTKASKLNRTSALTNLKRANGQIVLQGVENQRAYSLVIDERQGQMSVAIAVGGCSITAFGWCTPLQAGK